MGKNEKPEINDATLFAYLGEELSLEEKSIVETWLETSLENKEYFKEIRRVWELTGEKVIKPVTVDRDRAWENFKKQLDTRDVVKLKPKKSWNWIGIAAAIALLVGGIYFFKQGSLSELKQYATKERVLETELPDGSMITLNENSSLTHERSFSQNERRVSLNGEAFFHVARDTTKQFVVELPHTFEVRVLGTSFNIDASKEQNFTEILVESGKVEVRSNLETKQLIKGEKAKIDNASGRIEIVEVTSSTTDLFWKTKEVNFDGESMEEAIKILEEIYNAEIKMNCGDKNQPIRSLHQNESIEQVLMVISAAQGLKYVEKVENGKTVHFLNCPNDN